MNYDETLKYIHSLGKFSYKASLERIKLACEHFSNPQDRLKIIHIAGTNGKGSVSTMIANVLENSGYKTGLFVSPFIINFCERIQINRNFISEDDLIFYSQKVIDSKINLTEFEFITMIAFLYFNDKNCDYVVLETGLGGRFDATNIIKHPILNIITKIGLDHTAILGETIEEITREKCGIIKDCPLITIYNQDATALKEIKKSKYDVICPNGDLLKVLKCDSLSSEIIYKGKQYKLSLVGEYQIDNAITVIEAIERLRLDISYETLYHALANTFFPARLEIISQNPLIVLDGAHNPDGANALKKFMSHYNGEITAIIGVMKDKNYKNVLKETLVYCKNAVVVTVFDNPRSLSKEELYNDSKEYTETYIGENYSDAIDKAIEISGGKPIFIYGSLYLASGIREQLIKKFKKI